MAKNLAVNVIIGGSVSGTLGAAFASAKGTIGSLKLAAKDLGKQHADLGKAIESGAGKIAPAALGKMQAQYARLGTLIEEAKRKQDALTASLQRGAALKAQRADLMSSAMGTIGTGAAIGVPLGMMVRESARFADQMRDIAITAQFSADQERAVGMTVRDNAKRWGMAHEDVGRGVSTLVAGGVSDAEELRTYTGSVTKGAKASGASVDDVAKSFLAMKQNLGITAKDSESAFSMLAVAGKAGNFEVRDMAKWLPNLAPQMKALGVSGKDAVAQLGAMLQVARVGAGTADEAANNLANFLGKVTQAKTKKDFGKAGIDIGGIMKADARRGISPVESMIGAIERYVSTKGPEASKKFKDAMSIEDAAKREAAMQALQSAYKLSDLFVDRQVLDFLRPMLAQKKLYEDIRNQAMAEGQKAPGKTQLDVDAAARMATTGAKFGVINAAAKDLAITIGDALAPGIARLIDQVTPLIGKFGEWAGKNPELIAGAVKLVGGMLGARLAFTGLGLAVNLIRTPLNLLGTAFAMVSGKWTLLKAALQFGNLARIGSMFGSVASGAVRLGAALGGGLLAGMRAFGTAVMFVGRALMSLFLSPVGLAIAAVAALAAGAYLVYRNWDQIKAKMAAWGAAIKQWGQSAQTSLNQFINNSIAGLSGWATSAAAAFGQFKDKAIAWVGQAWEGIKSSFTAGLAAIRGMVGQFAAAGMAIIGALINAISSRAAEIVQAFRTCLQQGVAAVKSFVGQMFAAGAAIIGGLVDGIKSRVGAAVAAIGEVGAKIKATIQGALGIHSPSRVFAEFGRNIVAGLGQGISASVPVAMSAMDGLYRAVSSHQAPTLPDLGVTPILGGNVVPFESRGEPRMGDATANLRRMMGDYAQYAKSDVPGLDRSGRPDPSSSTQQDAGIVRRFDDLLVRHTKPSGGLGATQEPMGPPRAMDVAAQAWEGISKRLDDLLGKHGEQAKTSAERTARAIGDVIGKRSKTKGNAGIGDALSNEPRQTAQIIPFGSGRIIKPIEKDGKEVLPTEKQREGDAAGYDAGAEAWSLPVKRHDKGDAGPRSSDGMGKEKQPPASGVVIDFHPVINIKSDGKDKPDDIKKKVTDALQLSMRELERVGGQVEHYGRRTSYR